jgi:hypothetical protein
VGVDQLNAASLFYECGFAASCRDGHKVSHARLPGG